MNTIFLIFFVANTIVGTCIIAILVAASVGKCSGVGGGVWHGREIIDCILKALIVSGDTIEAIENFSIFAILYFSRSGVAFVVNNNYTSRCVGLTHFFGSSNIFIAPPVFTKGK